MLIGHSQQAQQKGKVAGGDCCTLRTCFGYVCTGNSVEFVQVLQKAMYEIQC